jgi:predicted dehydrogenase
MGSYPLTWAMSVFGEPVTVRARSLFADNGVESQTSVTLEYFGGGSADLTASFLSFGPSEATVVGSRGWLRTARSLHSPQSFVVSLVDGSTVDYFIPHIGNGYVYELREVMACMHKGERESRLMPLAESLATIKIIDEVRRQTFSHE